MSMLHSAYTSLNRPLLQAREHGALVATPRRAQVQVQCRQENSGRGGGNSKKRMGKRARQPGLFEVRVASPPPRSLGIWALPPHVHNGEEVDLDGEGYVITSVTVQMKLQGGKYKRWHHRLDVQPTGRYFLNMMLENLVNKAEYIGPTDTGLQD